MLETHVILELSFENSINEKIEALKDLTVEGIDVKLTNFQIRWFSIIT